MIHFVYWNGEQAWDEEPGNVASSFGSGYELTAMTMKEGHHAL